MFAIEMMPARQGDSLWIEYGDPARPHRAVLDGGTSGTYHDLKAKFSSLPPNERRLDLLVVTHIDDDHIAGILSLLNDEELGIDIRDLWFNGFRHLPDSPLEALGPVQGEKLTDRLLRLGLSWNADFEKGPVSVGDEGESVTKHLPGGLALSVLSPGTAQLAALKPVWAKVVREAGLDPEAPRPEEVDLETGGLERLGVVQPPNVEMLAASEFEQDTSEANGSTIAMLAEHDGKRILLTGDAHPQVLMPALERLSPSEPFQVDALQVPHHGSRHNLSHKLVESVNTQLYLFSTSGARHHHPHPESVARVLASKQERATLVFNYRSSSTAVWDQPQLRDRWEYDTLYPPVEAAGIRVSL